MHFAPDMIPSGMALSGADMIWLSTVLAVWTRSTCAPRFWHQAQVVIEKINNTAATIFFMARLRSRTVCSASLWRLHPSYEGWME